MKRLSYLSLCFGLILGSAAHAVPLFGEAAGTIKDGNLTLYKDDSDPHKVYYFPNSSRLSLGQNKVPLFNFTYWGISTTPMAADAGAYMSLTTHLAPDESQQQALDNYVKNHPDMEVAVLPIKSSKVGLNSNTGNPALDDFFKEFDFPPVGGRAEDQIGVNATLTGRGAKVFYSQLKNAGGGGMLKFDYCYDFQGFGPSMNASIVAKMQEVYDYFEAHASSGGFWHKADIRRVTEILTNNKSIVITQNGGDATDSEIINRVADEITKMLFTEILSHNGIPAADGNRLWNFGVSSVHRETLTTYTWTWNRRELVEEQFCTAVDLRDLAGFADKLIVSAD